MARPALRRKPPDDVEWSPPDQRDARAQPLRVGLAAAIAIVIALGAGTFISDQADPPGDARKGSVAGGADGASLSPSPRPTTITAVVGAVERWRSPSHAVGRRCGVAGKGSGATGLQAAPRWASSTGDVDVHGYGTYPDRALHVIYVRVLWAADATTELRNGSEWRANISVGVPPGDAVAQRLPVEHWSTDLPGACLDDSRLPGTGGALTFSIATRNIRRLKPNRPYVAEIHFAAPYDLNGTWWRYHEELRAVGRATPVRTRSRQGVIGTCRECVVRWSAEPRA